MNTQERESFSITILLDEYRQTNISVHCCLLSSCLFYGIFLKSRITLHKCSRSKVLMQQHFLFAQQCSLTGILPPALSNGTHSKK